MAPKKMKKKLKIREVVQKRFKEEKKGEEIKWKTTKRKEGEW